MKDWHLIKTSDVLEELNTSKEGLSSKEASKRLKKYGKNELPKKKQKGFIRIFFSQFASPIVYILLIAMILSFIVNEITDGIFILIVVVSDAILGAYEEYRSDKASENLTKLIKVEATIIRDGKIKVIPSTEVVIGDIVLLESGTRVPADIRLIETQNLSIDESLLTGESIPRDKNSKVLEKDTILNDRFNMAYVGTSVMRGRAKGVVVSTGINTEIGKIAKEVLEKEETPTPLQIRMEKFTKQLGMIIALLALVISFILYFKNYTTREIFFLVVALSVSAIPEGLPMVITLSLSISSNKMAKRNVLVKKLNAVEALGSATVIATDKTGTLTLNEQTVKKIILPSGESLNNEASLTKVKGKWISLGDSMEIALHALCYKHNLKIEDEVLGRIPYESEAGYSSCFYKNSKTYVSVKGSLETVLDFSTSMKVNGRKAKLNKEIIRKQNEELARNGYRVLAFASGEVKDFKEKEKYTEKDLPSLTFIGLIAFVDPVREDAKDAVIKCKNAGIKVVMITGDHPLTAYSVAKDLKIATSEEEVVTGTDLDRIRLKGDREFDRFIKDKTVFARVTPIQKLEIVESFKRMDEFIAVTGDGVNDSPALKAANVSIAMGSGTDVAKETGSLIIVDDKFSSIVGGVEEGRISYSNVRKVVHMLLSCGVCEVMFFVLAIVFDFPAPLTAVQLLWLNLVTDGLQDVALSFEEGEKDIMKKHPRKPTEGLFDRLLINEIVLNGLFMGITVFLVWTYLLKALHLDLVQARTCILILMVFMQNIHCFNCRSEKLPIFKKPLKENKYLLFGVLAVLALQVFAVENEVISSFLGLTTIPYKDILTLFLLALPIIVISELIKYFERKRGGEK